MELIEKLPHKIDIARLKSQFEKEILPLPRSDRPGYSGWSVLSSTGDYLDGWHSGSGYFSDPQLKEIDSETFLAQINAKQGTEYAIPTQICNGYIESVIQLLTFLDLQPHRVQIAHMAPHTSLPWHQDSPDNAYCVRLHIPIITNEACFFEFENSRHHLPADGSMYLLNASLPHRFVNNGEQDRYHLVSYVYDIGHISQKFKYQLEEI